MNKYRSICIALLGASLLAAAPADAGMLGKKAMKSGETIGPAANGDPKPYQAHVEGECAGSFCTINFGKKPKVRTIKLITCGLITDEDPALGGIVFDDANVQFYLPLASSAPSGTSSVGMFEFDFEFEVPANTRLSVILQGSGTASDGVCTATGTIK